MSSHSFCAYTADEQKNGLELEAFRNYYRSRKSELAEVLKQSRARLDSRPFIYELAEFAELKGRPEFEAALEEFTALNQLLHDQAVEDGYALETDWQSHLPRLERHKGVMFAVMAFKETYDVDPVVDPDLPSPEELNSRIYDYEALVKADLETTRELVSTRAPELLGSWELQSVELYFENGGDGGSLVEDAADSLLANRIKLANLRARVEDTQKPAPVQT